MKDYAVALALVAFLAAWFIGGGFLCAALASNSVLLASVACVVGAAVGVLACFAAIWKLLS